MQFRAKLSLRYGSGPVSEWSSFSSIITFFVIFVTVNGTFAKVEVFFGRAGGSGCVSIAA